MKHFILISFLTFITVTVKSQSYEVNYFQTSYNEITDYNSIALESFEEGLGLIIPFHKEFEFGFFFPAFENTYASVDHYLGSAYGTFPHPEGYSASFYLFGPEYRIVSGQDAANIESDIRFKSTQEDGINALVIEYYNVRCEGESQDNHYLNFQHWFYENGIIELRFGDINLDNCSSYIPGQGFVSVNPLQPGGLIGPWVVLYDELGLTVNESISFSGDHTNPEYTGGAVTSIPSEGFVVQFMPTLPSYIDENSQNEEDLFSLNMNNETIEIVGDLSKYKSCEVFDLTGRKIISSSESSFELISESAQILVVQIETMFGYETHQLLVN